MHECGFSRTLIVARMYEKTNLIKVSRIHYMYTTPNFSSIRSERLSDSDSDSDTVENGPFKIVRLAHIALDDVISFQPQNETFWIRKCTRFIIFREEGAIGK